jgi:hypothetical protein
MFHPGDTIQVWSARLCVLLLVAVAHGTMLRDPTEKPLPILPQCLAVPDPVISTL